MDENQNVVTVEETKKGMPLWAKLALGVASVGGLLYGVNKLCSIHEEVEDEIDTDYSDFEEFEDEITLTEE